MYEKWPGLSRFPHFKLFKRGIPWEYQQKGQEWDDFHHWAYKTVYETIKRVKEEEELEREIAKHEFVVLYVGEEQSFEFQKVFRVVAKRFNKAFFALAEDALKQQLAEEQPRVLMFRGQEANMVEMRGEWEHQRLERFVSRNLVPDVFYFSEKHDIIAFVHSHPVVVLIRNVDDPEQRRVEHQFNEVALAIKEDQ